MPLLAQEHVPISTKDIISWCYDNRDSFDQDKPIYVDCANPSRSLSANQTYSLIRKLVAGFRAKGFRKGDVVCIHSFNNLYYPPLVQGTIAAGGCFVGTNPSYTPFELRHAFKTAKARFVIVEPDLLAAPRETALKLGIPEDRILILGEHEEARGTGHASWRTLLEHGEEDWVRFDDLETAQNTAAFMMFSSGTTGLPKAAVQSHYNLIAENTLVHENPKYPEPFHFNRIVCLPMFHTSTAPYAFTTTLRSGRESFIMKRFALPDFLVNMDKFQVTNAILVPPMVISIVQAAVKDEQFVRRCLRHVKSVLGGAAPLDSVTQAKLQALLPEDATCTQLWAMSETTCVACYFFWPENDDTASVGRFVQNIDVKLIDPDAESDGAEVALYDTRGELCVRGPTVIKGYFENPEANARDWDKDGFFHTGDILYCDSTTKLWYIVDRKKELIKVRGFQVAPNEIEGVLLLNAKVKDTAVIGIPDGKTGSEMPRAYVVANESMTEHEVKDWVRSRLAKYKELTGGVRFVDNIPKTASGKIIKRALREEAKKELQDQAKL